MPAADRRARLIGFRVIDAFSRIVRLGEGLGNTAICLSDGAIERTVEALRDLPGQDGRCKEVVRAKPRRYRSLPARRKRRRVRRARRRDELGLDLEVVDRRTEAYLAVTGCASLADPEAESVVMFDIGGGSTEIAWLDGAATEPPTDPTASASGPGISLPVGVVHAGGTSRRDRRHAGKVREHGRGSDAVAARFHAHRGPGGARTQFHLLGTSGTVTTVGGMHLGLQRYDRRRVDGLWMQRQGGERRDRSV